MALPNLNSEQARRAIRLARYCDTSIAERITAIQARDMSIADVMDNLNRVHSNLAPHICAAAMADENVFRVDRSIYGATFPHREIMHRFAARFERELLVCWVAKNESDAIAIMDAIRANGGGSSVKRASSKSPRKSPRKSQSAFVPRPVNQEPIPAPANPSPVQEPAPMNPAALAQDPAAMLAQALQALLAAQKAQVDPTIIEALEKRLSALESAPASGPRAITVSIERPSAPTITLEGNQHFRLPGLIELVSDLRAWGVPDPVCLVGPAGTGKTHSARSLAEALGIPFYTTSIGPATMESRLIGYMDANGKMVRTPIREAVEFGGVCLIDEFDAGSPQSLLVLNALTANSHIGFADGVIARHKDLVIIFAANTYGRGAADGYKRSAQDRALLDRIAWYAWPIDPALELSMINGDRRSQDYILALREALKTAKVDLYLSPRATRRFACLIGNGRTFEHAREVAFGYSGMGADAMAVVSGVRF